MSEYRVLVADDQPEIARELLAGLKSPEFKLEFVNDGETALRTLTTGPVFDAVIVDMRMPPNVWGGLWLIENVRSTGLEIPIIVLSGEAGQAETIQAMRLGANDWVAKEDATREIAPQLRDQLKKAEARAVAHISDYLPSPIGERVTHYKDSKTKEGGGLEGGLATITAIESVWRFLALVNLSALHEQQVLRGVVEQQMLRPTMGIYLDLLKAAAKLTTDNTAMLRLSSCIPLSEAHHVVIERNRGIGHPVGAPGLDVAVMELAEKQLLTFLRRFSDNHVGFLGTAKTMTFEHDTFVVNVEVHGATSLAPVQIESKDALTSGDAFWISDSGVTRLWPWIVESKCEGGAATSIFLFDGVKVRGKDLENLQAPFIYTGCSKREPLPTGGTLENLLALFSAGQA